MKKSIKYQISKILGSNMELNKKALNIKRSWDEVSDIIGKGSKKKNNKKNTE